MNHADLNDTDSLYMASETTFVTFLLTPRHECGGTTPNMPDAAIHDPAGQAPTFVWSRREGRQQNGSYMCSSIHYCHAIGNDLPVDHDELGFVRLNRTCGHSTSAWYQLANGLRLVNGGNG